MSMPSDTTADISDAIENEARVVRPKLQTVTTEQSGLIAAAMVAFVGIAYFGPAIARLTRGPSRSDRAGRALREARNRAEAAGRETGKRMRRLGGGPVWR